MSRQQSMLSNLSKRESLPCEAMSSLLLQVDKQVLKTTPGMKLGGWAFGSH